jgi:hypothetical protein
MAVTLPASRERQLSSNGGDWYHWVSDPSSRYRLPAATAHDFAPALSFAAVAHSIITVK